MTVNAEMFKKSDSSKAKRVMAPPVQHFYLCMFQFFKDSWKLSVIIKGCTPAQDSCQVIARAKW